MWHALPRQGHVFFARPYYARPEVTRWRIYVHVGPTIWVIPYDGDGLGVAYDSMLTYPLVITDVHAPVGWGAHPGHNGGDGFPRGPEDGVGFLLEQEQRCSVTVM